MAEWMAREFGSAGVVRVFMEVTDTPMGWYLGNTITDSDTEESLFRASSDHEPELPEVGDILQIDDEDILAIKAASSQSFGAGFDSDSWTRGYGGTTAAAHDANTGVRLFREFSKLVDGTTKHRILTLPKIKHTAEKELHTITSSVTSMKVDNRDGQWNNPTWFGGWRGRMVRFYWCAVEESRLPDGTADPDYYMRAMGTFLVDDVVVNADDTADISLVSMDTPLKEDRGAEGVKGKGWHEAKSAKWLITKLLAAHYSMPKESPPAHWVEDIPDDLEIETQGDSPVFSHYGRLPEWDGDSWLSTTEIVRAVAFDSDHEKLFYGVGDTLWYRDLSTGVDTEINSTAIDGFDIVRLWRASRGGDDRLVYGVALKPELQPGLGLSVDDQQPQQEMYIFWVKADLTIGTSSKKTGVVSGYLQRASIIKEYDPPDYDAWEMWDECMAVPFKQNITTYGHASSYRISTGKEANDYTLDHIRPSYQWFGNSSYYNTYGETDNRVGVTPGVRSISAAGTGGESQTHALHSCGQRGAFAYDPGVGTKGAVYYCVAVSPASGYDLLFNIVKHDCSSGSATSASTADLEGQPTALVAFAGNAYCARFDTNVYSGIPAGTLHYADSYLTKHNSALSSVTEMWTNSGDDVGDDERFYTILEMCRGRANYIHVVCLVRGPTALYDGTSNYKFLRISSTGTVMWPQKSPNGSYTWHTQPVGLCYDPDENPGYTNFAAGGDGSLLRFDGTDQWTRVRGGDDLVVNEAYTTGTLAVNVKSSTPADFDVYGVSSPSPSFYTESAGGDYDYTFEPGKYYLWKMSRKIADRFPLADFSDWSLWKAITMIAHAVQHVAWFDERGKFRFDPVPVPGESGQDYEFDVACQRGSPEIHAPWMTVPSMSLGYKGVLNYATAMPYEAILEQPQKPILKLCADSELNDDANGAPPIIEISSQSTIPVRTILRCSRGGRLHAGVDGQRPEFTKTNDTSRVNLMLTQTLSTGTQLYVDHIPVDENGDSLVYGNMSGNGDYVTIGDTDYWSASNRTASVVSVSQSMIVVSDAITTDNDGDSIPYPAGTPVTIYKRGDGVDDNTYIFEDGVPVNVGNGVIVKMTAGVEALADEPRFHVGDTLIIDSPGLQLEKATRSVRSVVNVESIQAGHPKAEAKIQDNRMLTKATALELTRSTVNRYAWPHYELKGGAWRLIPWLRPFDVLNLRDPRLFRHTSGTADTQYKERTYVQSVEHNIGTMTTRVDLRGTRDVSA